MQILKRQASLGQGGACLRSQLHSKFQGSLDYMKSCLRQTLKQSHEPLNHNSPQALGNGHPFPHSPLHPAGSPVGGAVPLRLTTPHQSLTQGPDGERPLLWRRQNKRLCRALPSFEGHLLSLSDTTPLLLATPILPLCSLESAGWQQRRTIRRLV